MKSLLLPTLCALLVLPCAIVTAQSSLSQQSTQQITPLPVSSPPTIDGKLDEPCWRNAEAVTGFRLNNGKGAAKHQTIARMCCDAENLYIAMECIEPETDKLKMEQTQDDVPIWLDDCVEMFIAPNAIATKENFHHFVVNARGCKAYLYAEAPRHRSAEWRAAGSVGDGRWFAEMAIPFKMLEPIGTNDPFWRIQFAREDVVHAESSTWSEVPVRFASVWRFGRLLPPKDGPKFVKVRGDIKPITPSGKASAPRQITPASVADDLVIIPEPRLVKRTDGQFTITPKTRILIGKSDDPMDRRPAEEINQELQLVAGFTLPIEVADGSNASAEDCIIVGERWLNPAAEQFCQTKGVRVSHVLPGKEGYVLEVGAKSVLISGSDQLGTFWGAQTFRQLLRRSMTGASAVVPCVSVRDWPKFGCRGVHLLVTKDALSFHGRLIEKLLSRYKINNILLQCEHVEWDSHPEIRNPDRAMSKDDVRALIKVANDHHITVTPLLQAMGHVGWAFYGKNNLEMAEDPTALYAYCPRNPKAQKFMNDLTDEVYELFGRPEYMHMGLDEFDMRGQFPYHEECKQIGKAQMYIDETLRLREYLKSKGARMMMWGDILLKPEYADKIAQLPRDIVICDWHYSPNKEYPSLDFYRAKGFRIIGCTWYNPMNLFFFSEESHKRGIEGMMQTTWTGFLTEDVVMQQEFHQIHSYIMGAAWAWSPGTPKWDNMPWESDQVFSQIWYAGESKPVSAWYAVDLAAFVNVSLKDGKDKLGWLGLGEGTDLSGLPTGTSTLGGIPYDLGSSRSAVMVGGVKDVLKGFGDKVTGIPVKLKANRLHFLQTTAYGDWDGKKIAEYVIRYSDGSTAKADLIYGLSISSWDAVRPASRNRSAWRGTTLAGDIIRVNTFTWDNPHPEKMIESFDLVAADSQGAPVLIAVTAEVGGE